MRSRGWTFNYLVFDLIVDLLIFAAVALLWVVTAKGQSASQPVAVHSAAPKKFF